MYFEAKTFLHGLLVVEDKLSMAHGLETRVPFLDNDLVDFAMRCPVGLKLNNLQRGGAHQRERARRQAAASTSRRPATASRSCATSCAAYIPQDIADGVKQGFSAPDASWFKGDSIDYVRKQLLDGAPRIYDYLDRATVRGLVDEHLAGQQNRRLFIWSLLSVEQWLAGTYA